MNFEEATTILNDFKEKNPNIFFSDNVHGLIVTHTDKGFSLQLIVIDKKEKGLLAEDEIMAKWFKYEFEGLSKEIQCEVVERPIMKSQQTYAGPIKAGMEGKGYGLMGYGTAGWNVYLNGTLISLSNWHVFCPKGNDTPLGNRVIINNLDVASLFAFQPITPFEYNTWDYAIAKFDNPEDVLGSLVSCSDGEVYSYPQKLSTNVQLGDGAKYYKVGARTPVCREGSLIGIGNFDVDYKNGLIVHFINQLIFSKMSDGGDSGAIIVRSSDNTVTGLNFAGGKNHTAANPFFKIGWTFQGTLKNEVGIEIPMFISNEVPNSTFNKVTLFGDTIPKLQAGKYFLGTRLAIINSQSGQIEYFAGPEIPPIRDVAVEYILGYPQPKTNQSFYFGGDPRDQHPTRYWIMYAFG